MDLLLTQDIAEKNVRKSAHKKKYERITDEFLGPHKSPNKLNLFLESNKRFLAHLEEQLHNSPKKEYSRLKKDIEDRKNLIAYLEGRITTFSTPVASIQVHENKIISEQKNEVQEMLTIHIQETVVSRSSLNKDTVRTKNLLFVMVKKLFLFIYKRGPFLKRK